MYMVSKTLANYALKFIEEMMCTWLSLKFALKFMVEMTCTWFPAEMTCTWLSLWEK